jgi:hypothetical protein
MFSPAIRSVDACADAAATLLNAVKLPSAARQKRIKIVQDLFTQNASLDAGDF